MSVDTLSHLVDPNQDIIPSEQSASGVPEILGQDVGPSQSADTVYVQREDFFKPTNRKQAEKIWKLGGLQKGDSADMFLDADSTTISRSIFAHQIFSSFAFVVQGLIAGFSIFHAMIVILRTPPFYPFSNFIQNTHNYALIFHCMYYAALVISLVSIFDKYDVATDTKRVLWRAITLQSTCLSSVCWALALGFSLAGLPAETRMDLYSYNYTELFVKEEDSVYYEQPWTSSTMEFLRFCIVARSVFATLGWIIVALRSGTDQLRKHLRRAEADFRDMMVSNSTATLSDVK